MEVLGICITFFDCSKYHKLSQLFTIDKRKFWMGDLTQERKLRGPTNPPLLENYTEN